MKAIKINVVPMSFEKTFEIKLENINQVYRGKLDGCRCGCGGCYLYTKKEADSMNEGRDEHFMKGSDKAIKNDLKKFASGDYPIKFWEYEDENILEIETHIDEYVDGIKERIGVTIYLKK